MIFPDWKIKRALQIYESHDVSNEHKDVRNLVSVLNGTCTNPDAMEVIQECLEIYKSQGFSKEILEGCLLCENASLPEISAITGYPIDLIEVYSHFFFDMATFKYRIQRFEYVRTYSNKEFPDAKLYKSWAMGSGITFFKWHLKVAGSSLSVPPKEVLSEIVGDSFFRAKEHLNEPITSEITRESLKWIKQASESIGALTKLESTDKGSNELTTFKLTLEHKDYTTSSEDDLDLEIIE